MSDPETAIGSLEQLIAERPDWAIARAYLGIAYLRATRVADAREALEAAVQIAPASFICRSKYGEFLARLGFYDQAKDQLDVALSMPAPDNDSRYAAMELRQFCKDKSKGIFYRQSEFPHINLGRVFRVLTLRRTAAIVSQGGN
jgi:Tfp pilus assembly protein PilF